MVMDIFLGKKLWKSTYFSKINFLINLIMTFRNNSLSIQRTYQEYWHSSGKIHTCLRQCSDAVKRHYDDSSSYKRIHLIGAILQLQRFSPFLSWWGVWKHTGSYVAGEVAESSSMDPQSLGRERVTESGLGFFFFYRRTFGYYFLFLI